MTPRSSQEGGMQPSATAATRTPAPAPWPCCQRSAPRRRPPHVSKRPASNAACVHPYVNPLSFSRTLYFRARDK
eukprot:349948-Chlamydomonas_euryale.AAC.2